MLTASPTQPRRHGPHQEDRDHSGTRSARTQALLEAASRTDDPDERRRLQDEVVMLHLAIARSIAGRYRGRGIAEEDLAQAASIALLKAARGYDSAIGVDFLPYAVVSMQGEVKRQFRDLGWMVRPPRPIQRMQTEVNRAQAELTHELGRSPRVSEVAERLGVEQESVVEALAADGCYSPTSLDAPVGTDAGTSLGDLLPADDASFSEAEARVMLAPAVRALPERERTVVYLRFFRQHTQAQIAREIGATQMQVSRMLARVLAELRDKLA